MANSGKYSPHRNRLSDRDMLLDLLTTEKYMSHLYDHAIMEATDDTVRDTFIALQQDEHESAQMLFDFLHQQGWYTTGAGRQQFGRRLQSSQRLSGGRQQFKGGAAATQPRTDSRYAVASGTRSLGQNLPGGRPPSGRQPVWAGQGKRGRADDRTGWYY
jgi:hypothetical protein